MKKLKLLVVSVCLFLSLVGCDYEVSVPTMYLEPAQLTEEEENMANLLGLYTKYHIFDFVVDDSIQSIQVNTYQLRDGAWDLISGGGGHAFSDPCGRIALGVDRIPDGLRVALQSEHTNSSNSHTSAPETDFKLMSYTTSFLSDQTDIIYEQEIPLVIQIIKDDINSCHVEDFSNPEEFAEYEYVYAIAVRFSQKTVSELSEEK